jgi:hypothetical protein
MIISYRKNNNIKIKKENIELRRDSNLKEEKC